MFRLTWIQPIHVVCNHLESCKRVWFYIWRYTEKYMLRRDVKSQFTCEQKGAWNVSVPVTDKNLNLNTVTFDHKNKHISRPWVNMLFLRKSPPHDVLSFPKIHSCFVGGGAESVWWDEVEKKLNELLVEGSCQKWNETTLSRVEKKGCTALLPQVEALLETSPDTYAVRTPLCYLWPSMKSQTQLTWLFSMQLFSMALINAQSVFIQMMFQFMWMCDS